MRSPQPLLTPRLSMRTLRAEAANGPYRRWMNDPDVLRYLEARRQHHDVASLTAFIDQANASRDSLLLGMHLRTTDDHIGNIKLGPIDWDNARGEVGIIVGERSVWGQGLGTEALIALSRHAFGDLKLRKLTAGILDPNRSSVRIFEKAGYRIEAVLKEHNRLDDDWVDVIRLALFSSDPAR